MRRVVVFACGEPLRGDDGSGPAAIEGLSPAARTIAEVRARPSLSAEDLLGLSSDIRVVVVDAVTGAPPGDLVRERLSTLERVAARWVPLSGHQLPLATTVALARALGWAGDGTFLGIGARGFGLGDGLSGTVASALPALTEAVEREIVALAGS